MQRSRLTFSEAGYAIRDGTRVSARLIVDEVTELCRPEPLVLGDILFQVGEEFLDQSTLASLLSSERRVPDDEIASDLF